MYSRTPVLRVLDRNRPINSPTPAVVRKKCQEIEDVANKLRTQLREERDKNDDLHLEVRQLKEESITKDKKIQGLNDVVFNLRSRLTDSVESSVHDALLKEYAETKKKLQDLLVLGKNTAKLKKEYEDELDSLRIEVEKLNDQLASAEAFKAKYEESEAEKNFFVDHVRKLTEKLHQSEQLREDDIKTLQETYEEKIAVLQEKLEAKEEEITFMQPNPMIGPNALCSTFTVENPAPESLGFIHEIKCSELEDEIKSLTNKYDDEVISLQQQLAQLQQQHGQEVLRLEQQLREVVCQSAHEVKGKDEQIELKSNIINDLERKLEEGREDLLQLRKEVDEFVSQLKTRVDDVERDTSNIRSQFVVGLETLKEEVGHLSEEVVNRTRDLMAADELIQDLLKQIQDRDEEISVLRGQLDHHNKTSSGLETDVTDLKQQLAQKASQIEELWEKLIEADGICNKERCEQESLLSRNRELEVQVEQQQLLIANLQGQLTEIRLDMESEINSLKQKLEEEEFRFQTEMKKKQTEAMKLSLDVELLMKQIDDEKKRHLEEQEILKKKLEGTTKVRENVTDRLQDEIASIRKNCSETHVKEIQRLNEELTRIGTLLARKEKQISRGMEEIEMMEQSFTMERLQKKRYQEECIRLEAQLDKLAKASANTAGNNTYICPTINVHSSNAEVAGAVVKSLADNMTGVKTNNQRMIPPTGSSFYISEEPSEVMNVSSVSGSRFNESHTETFMIEEDPHQRLAQLQERNARQPPALKCSYAAELQELKVDESALKELTGSFMPGKMTETVTVTRRVTREVNVTDASKRAGIISPSSRSVFKRSFKGSWSPKLSKPFDKVPY